MSVFQLTSRGVVRVSGPDAAALLNGLLTNDVGRAGPTQAVYAAMLTPQGKYLFDMFVLAPEPDVFWLDVSRAADFAKRLAMYRLRSSVTIEDQSDSWGIQAVLPDTAGALSGFSYKDPRHASLGSRCVSPSKVETSAADYKAYCLELGIPDPVVDLLVEKDFIMEGLFDELQGLDHHKGCYVGQEMTSRMKRRMSVKNKLCRVRYQGDAPAFETPIMAAGWEVGRMRSGINGVGIAMIRFDRARKALSEGQALMACDVAIALDPPSWLIEPEF
jgi:tRNA-modifying protein YgfZ